MRYILIALFFVSCAAAEKKEESLATDSLLTESDAVAMTAQQLAGASIETGKPTVERVSGSLPLQGAIDVPPSHLVNLSFPIGGYIRSIKVLPGEKVHKGAVIATIEDMQFIQLQQDYLTAKTNKELAEKEWQRQVNLNAGKATSDKVFQEAKAEMERQQILMSSLAQKLELIGIRAEGMTPAGIVRILPIRSPVNGFVSKVNISVGRYTSPTDVLFELIDPSDLHLALRVYEKDLSRITRGAKVSAYTNADPQKKYGATVIQINPNLDENRSTEIHCHFDREDASLTPGMFMNAELNVADVKALTVPEDAVVRWENKHYVFVREGGDRFTMKEVKPGLSANGRQQISGEGIDERTELVTRNAFALLMRLKNAEE